MKRMDVVLGVCVMAMCGAGQAGWAAEEDSAKTAEQDRRGSRAESLIRRFDDPARDAWQQPEKVLDLLEPLKDKVVADIGAGSGYFTFRLPERGARVVAIDIDEGMLKHLETKRQASAHADRIEVRKTAPDRSGLKPSEADVVFMVNTYHHISDRVAYLGDLRKGLSPDGRLVIVDFFKRELPVGPPPDHKLAREIAEKELREAGFRDLRVDTETFPNQYVIEVRKP